MNSPDLFIALQPVVDAFDELEILYSIGGSVGSSFHGLARATLDIDLVADIQEKHILRLVERLSEDYYIDENMIRSAIEKEFSFNLIHLETMLKVDVFVLKRRQFDRSAFARRHKQKFLSDGEYYVATPEDLILHKLEWYEMGGRVSERQWRDVIGLLKVQASHLDWDYLIEWAEKLQVLELLNQAKNEATNE